jgi:aldehyde dehydrogenase (NAD+)
VHWSLPYGGWKMSGIGRENGMAAIEEYTELRTVFIEI